jgi:hypothetical protein
MPTREEWRAVHAVLMTKLGLPCKIKFTDFGIGRHDWDDNQNECFISINPTKADFRVPEHLILHEAAHHRAIEPFLNGDRPDIKPCGEYGGHCSHCHHWAHILCDIYREVGIALPYSTGFEEFARASGIKFKLFDPSANNQMIAVEKNVRLIEGA